MTRRTREEWLAQREREEAIRRRILDRRSKEPKKEGLEHAKRWRGWMSAETQRMYAAAKRAWRADPTLKVADVYEILRDEIPALCTKTSFTTFHAPKIRKELGFWLTPQKLKPEIQAKVDRNQAEGQAPELEPAPVQEVDEAPDEDRAAGAPAPAPAWDPAPVVDTTDSHPDVRVAPTTDTAVARSATVPDLMLARLDERLTALRAEIEELEAARRVVARFTREAA